MSETHGEKKNATKIQKCAKSQKAQARNDIEELDRLKTLIAETLRLRYNVPP